METLPKRFEGTGADYRVVEEDVRGIPRLLLIVSPQVGPLEPVAVRRAFLEAVADESTLGRIGAEMWHRAGTVDTRREWPRPTGVRNSCRFASTGPGDVLRGAFAERLALASMTGDTGPWGPGLRPRLP